MDVFGFFFQARYNEFSRNSMTCNLNCPDNSKFSVYKYLVCGHKKGHGVGTEMLFLIQENPSWF